MSLTDEEKARIEEEARFRAEARLKAEIDLKRRIEDEDAEKARQLRRVVAANAKSAKAQRNRGCLTALAVFALFVWWVGSEKKATMPSTPTARLPKYEIVDRKVYDTPVKTQVLLHAVVETPATSEELESVLMQLYEEASATRGFKFHGGKPTHVAVYVYTSREHFASGVGQRRAMLSKLGDGAPVDIDLTSGDLSPTSPHSSATVSPAKERYYRDSKGAVVSETETENQLREIRENIRSMPHNGERAYLGGALQALEAEWARMKREGPIANK